MTVRELQLKLAAARPDQKVYFYHYEDREEWGEVEIHEPVVYVEIEDDIVTLSEVQT